MNGAEAKPLVPEPVGLDHPLVIRHTQRILTLRRCRAEASVDVAVEIGQRLTEVKNSLAYGHWGRWLRDHVRFSHALSVRYMRLADLAKSDFKLVEKYKSLGPNKLFTLSQLSPYARDRMLAQDVHPVFHNGPRKSLAQMTPAEFNALSRSFDGKHRQRSPALRDLIRRGVAALEAICRVLPQIKGRRFPEGARSDRFRELLARARDLLAEESLEPVPAQR